MRRVAVIAAVVGALPGCFYFESINQRPSVQIENLSSESLSPGDTAMLRAVMEDPDGDFIKLRWRAYACTDAEKFEDYAEEDPEEVGCDVAPFYEKSDVDVTFSIPAQRMFLGPDSQGVSAESALVILEAFDEYGAMARPRAQLIIPIVNRRPTIELFDPQSRYSFVAGTPVRVLAKVGDDDNGPNAVALTWDVIPPAATGFNATLVDDDPAVISDENDTEHLQYAKIFTANDAGTWKVRVTAADPLGQPPTGNPDNISMDDISIFVIEDKAPCLAQLLPIVPPAGVAMPMSAPTLFRVPVVRDDLDPYPLIPNDEIFRATKFRWSIQNPGSSSHVVVASATGNTLGLDPGSYTPGDIVEVRVEIFDRKSTPIPCPDGEATCSTISQPTCLQRQTWRVEVR